MTNQKIIEKANADISAKKIKQISSVLKKIETDHNVKILFACESGSRSWGFPSPDSDYDVRFVYVHHEDWYLSYNVERQRDVIEIPIEGDLDVNGWDLKKAIALLVKGNAGLLEWLNSPVRYLSTGDIREELIGLDAGTSNQLAICHHYRGMAAGNWKKYIEKSETPALKKYLYVIRPLLAIDWIERFHTFPPVRFCTLLDVLDDVGNLPPEFRQDIDSLIEAKTNTSELGAGARIRALDDYIIPRVERFEFYVPASADGLRLQWAANELYRKLIRQYGQWEAGGGVNVL